MNNEPMGFYTPRLVLNDARRHGIGILPPHVNESGARYAVEADGRAIRVGLREIHRMNTRLLSAIESERGRFCIGVQWHPESFAMQDHPCNRLFGAFVQAAQRNH